jgi:hypothetical protein
LRRAKQDLSCDASQLLVLVKAPADRAFTSIRKLSLDVGYETELLEWAKLQDAVAAAVATWPQLEEVALCGTLMADEEEAR